MGLTQSDPEINITKFLISINYDLAKFLGTVLHTEAATGGVL